MNNIAESLNQTRFSQFINSAKGRIFRFTAGILFLVIGIILLNNLLGLVLIIWSIFPLSAGALDICYISALLGGPISGVKIRSQQDKK